MIKSVCRDSDIYKENKDSIFYLFHGYFSARKKSGNENENICGFEKKEKVNLHNFNRSNNVYIAFAILYIKRRRDV